MKKSMKTYVYVLVQKHNDPDPRIGKCWKIVSYADKAREARQMMKKRIDKGVDPFEIAILYCEDTSGYGYLDKDFVKENMFEQDHIFG